MKASALAILLLAAAAGAQAQGYVPEGGKDVDTSDYYREEKLRDDLRIGIGRIRYGGGGDWYADPSSLPNLLAEFEKRTGISTASGEKVVDPGDPAIFSTPFLYMTGHGNIDLGPGGLANLRNHLLAGGFLFADDNYGMDKSFRKMVRELFPERRLVIVPADHPVYHSFYDLPGPPKIHEHDGKPPQGLGVFDGDRLMVFYTYESDIGDGLEDADVHGDPPQKKEQAVRMAVNVLYYALTY